MEKLFNFNHEEYVLPIEVNEETGAVTMTLDGNELSFDSVNALAEAYAIARNVPTESLKNWVLVEDGDTYVFALRAATAGVDFDEDEYDDDEDEYDDDDAFLDEFDEEDDDEYEEGFYISPEQEAVIRYLGQYTDSDQDPVDQFIAALENADEEGQERLFEQINDTLERLKALYPNVSIAIAVSTVLKHHETHGEWMTSQEDAEEVNKRLKVAALARRGVLNVLLVDVENKTVSNGTQPVNTPVTQPTQVVANKIIIYQA